MKTSELIGPALDLAVELARSNGVAEPSANYWFEKWIDPTRKHLCEAYSTNWSQGGPIIERELIGVAPSGNHWIAADSESMLQIFPFEGTTPLVAAMRCYVASKLGEDVDIPEELK